MDALGAVTHNTSAHAISTNARAQAAVRAVRNARAEYGVEPGRRIAAAVVVASPALRQAYQGEAGVVASLARLDPDALRVVSTRQEALAGFAGGGGDGAGVIEVVVGEGVEVVIPLAGLFDAAKEVERLAKQVGGGWPGSGGRRALTQRVRYALRDTLGHRLHACLGFTARQTVCGIACTALHTPAPHPTLTP